MKTVNYNDAEQLFGAVGTSLKEHTAEIADIVNVYGAKNLIPNSATSQTINDVTFTVNSDGSVTANGTASNDARLDITEHIAFDFSNPLILNGGVNSNCVTIVGLYDSSKTYLREYISTGADIKISNVTNAVYLKVLIRVANGTVCNNVVFRPMIRLASIEDDTYVPYAMSNQQLTGLYDNEVEMGAVNLLENKANSTATSGVIITVNADKTVSFNNTSTSVIFFAVNDTIKLKKGRYRFTCCPVGGSNSSADNNYGAYVDVGIGSNHEKLYWDTGDGTNFEVTDDTDVINVRIRIRNATVCNNLTFKPMISFVSLNLSYDDYVPYAKSNKELTDDISSLAARIKAIEDTNHLTWG